MLEKLPPWTCPICPVICPVCPADILPLEFEFPHKSARTSRVSLGRPEFIPGTLPGHSDHQIPLCDSLYRFFSSIFKGLCVAHFWWWLWWWCTLLSPVHLPICNCLVVQQKASA